MIRHINNNKIYRLNDGILIRAIAKGNTRIDFLITEDVCFETNIPSYKNYIEMDFR